MKKTLTQSFLASLAIGLASLTTTLQASDLEPALQAKVDAQVAIIKTWGTDPAIVNAVKAQNASLPADYAAMTQDKWKALPVVDPFVRTFNKNEVGSFLKGKKTDLIIRAFVSDAAGIKVGFTIKTLSWSHKGDPKHELPMTGKVWQGVVEQDKASGLEQIQVSVPVLDGDKPIGSLVVGMSIGKLKE